MTGKRRAVCRPHRPALSPALYALVAVMTTSYAVLVAGGVGQALAELPCVPLDHAPLLFCALVIVVATATAHAIGARAWRPRAARVKATPRHLACAGVAAIGVLLGVAVVTAGATSSMALTAGAAFVHALGQRSETSWEYTVISDPTLTSRGEWRARVHAAAEGLPEGDLWLQTSAEFEIGDVIHVSDGFVANADDEWGRINRSQGVWGRLMPKGTVDVEGPRGLMVPIRALRDRARASIQPYSSEPRAILAGCVIGDRRAMDHFALDEVFSACGVSHLIAVSGGHIVIMSQVLGLLLGRLRLRPLPRLVLLAVLSGLYVLLTGAPAPAVRSWVMAMVGYGAQVAGRRSDSLSAISLVGIAMVLVDPGNVGQIGFVMSVVCVCGLCLFASYFTYALKVAMGEVCLVAILPRSLRRRAGDARDAACETLGATLVAQLATTPVSVPMFMQVSLVAPLANLVLTLPFTFLIGAGLVIACLPLPAPLASCALLPCDVVSSLVMGSLRLISRVPYASIPFELDGFSASAFTMAGGIVLLVMWPHLTRARASAAVGVCVALVASYVMRWGLLAPARIVVLDVGQGDAILVQDGSGAILVDAGPDDAIRHALARNHVLRLDAVVITHLHADHYGGLAYLSGFVSVGRVIVADGVTDVDEGGGWQAPVLADLRHAVESLTNDSGVGEVGYGDVLHVGGFVLRVVWPTVPVTGNENADSLEMGVAYRGWGRTLSALLTGDAERDETASVIAAGLVGDVDLLKVGHHGSAVSLSADEAAALAPKVAVASAGEGNSYGHPTPECVDVLERAGALFLCTKDVGDVCVSPGVDGPRVLVQREDPSP